MAIHLRGKAQIQVTFNWIFILLTGAVILFFFITAINKEKDSSQVQLAQTAGARLDAVFAVIQQNPNSVQVHNAPNYEMDFFCTEEGHYYSVKGSSTKSYLENDPIFSAKTIGRAKLVSSTKSFQTPYPTGPILYLSDEKNSYVFIVDSQDMRMLYADFPDKFSKINLTSNELNSLKDDGFREYIIISDGSINNPSSIPSNKITKIKITPGTDGIYSTGTLTFSIGNSNSDKKYVGQELLFAGIVSGKPDLYDCGLNKVLKKTQIVTQMNLNRTQELWLKYSGVPRCSSFYGEITKQYFNNISISAEKSNFESTDSSKNYINFYDSANDIKRVNDLIIRSDCTLLY